MLLVCKSLLKRDKSQSVFSMNSISTLQLFRLRLRESRLLFAWFLGLLMLFSISTSLPAQDEAGATETEVKIGLAGSIKLGKWVPILIESPINSNLARFEVSVIDGDDTPVVYSGPLLIDKNRPNLYQAWVRLGRSFGDVGLRLFDESNNLVEQLKLRTRGDSRMGKFQKSTQPLVLTLEPEGTCQSAIKSMSMPNRRDNLPVVATLPEMSELPLNWLGYDSVESIVLVTSDLDRIEKISSEQLNAIEAWVENGGTLILSVAQNGAELLGDDGRLRRFCPGTYQGPGDADGKRIEAFAESLDQLISRGDSPIAISRIDEFEGQVVFDDSDNHPLVIKQARGLGQIIFVAFDLDSERISNWNGFGNLVNRLVARQENREEDQQSQQNARGSSVSHYGYEDIIGQLRVPMDAFSNVRFVAFTLVALLIGLYILCIGPGDYFFLRKLLGKMELTWITFPLLSLVFCGLAIWISTMTRPDSIQLNQLEIIDIDTVQGRVRGSVWTNLYSPSGGDSSIEFEPAHGLGFQIDSDLLSWQGLPGDGLGGMLSAPTPSLLKTGYSEEIDLDGQRTKSRIVNLPLQVSSTKPMFGHWWSDNPIRIRSRLKHNAKLQQITGSVTNPFDYTLHNCRLMFENWAYVLDQPLGPGDTFDIVTETSEKNLKSLLTRRAKYSETKKRSDNSPWDPTDRRISRIADLMMFYSAAGGENYTGLSHGYQSFTDFTGLLNLNRAILVGEVHQQGVTFNINGQNVAEEYDQTLTIVRVLLPVEYSANPNN